jgi:peptide/nickel transport system ATP-binding protein
MLSVDNLSIKASGVSLLNQVSFKLNSQELLGIVGESGSGKSLTCLAIGGLLPKTLTVAGQIVYTDANGQSHDCIPMTPELRKMLALKHFAYVFQEPLTALNPVQTCGQQLRENLKLVGVKGRQAIEEQLIALLKEVELYDYERVASSYPFELSGGQRQRVMIAMALAGDPDIIIADEPTTALDANVQDGILKLLKTLCVQKGKSVILISHDLDAVAKYADRIAVFYKRQIIETGPTQTLINNPQQAYTKALLQCKPNPDRRGHYLVSIDNGQAQLNTSAYADAPPSDAQSILHIDTLSKTYTSKIGTVKALNNISFDIKKGWCTALIGESGSGKSTLSKLLVQLEASTEGQISYQIGSGQLLSSQVQMIFQDPFAALNPKHRIQTMFHEVLIKHRPDLDHQGRITHSQSLMQKVGLQANDLEKYPNAFSGGQRQRICIARALAVGPQLLICDESTSALDLSVQAQILNLLKQLQVEEGLSLLLITHSMAVAAWMSDYLLVLQNGQLLEQGLTADLIKNSQSAYTQSLLSHI